jgi:transposase-like protein
MNTPRNLLEFGRQFATEQACVDYLKQARWPHGLGCLHCGSVDGWWLESRRAFKCKDCKQLSFLTAGTVIEKSKTSLRAWFLGAWFLVRHTPGISAMQFQKEAGINRYETAFNILHKLRSPLRQADWPKLRERIEVDETFIGGERHGKRGRGAWGKSLVIGAAQVRGDYVRRIRLRVIKSAHGEILRRFITDSVDQGSHIFTDMWVGYQRVKEIGYEHTALESTAGDQDSTQIPHVHRIFSNLKTWLNGTHHGVSQEHLQAYLNEFCFRFNSRDRVQLAFNDILGLAAMRRGPTYRKLYRAGKKGGWVHPNPRKKEV